MEWGRLRGMHFKEEGLGGSRRRFKTVILSDSEESLARQRFFAIAQNDKARWLVISNVLSLVGVRGSQPPISVESAANHHLTLYPRHTMLIICKQQDQSFV